MFPVALNFKVEAYVFLMKRQSKKAKTFNQSLFLLPQVIEWRGVVVSASGPKPS